MVDRLKKSQVVESLGTVFSSNECVVVCKINALNAEDVTKLRTQARSLGAGFVVTKNTLVRIALNGSRFENIRDLFQGQTAIAYSDDPVAAAKLVTQFAKGNEDKLQVVGAGLGVHRYDAAQVKALASLPSLDELRARLLAVINTPATRIAGVLQAPAGQLARVFSAYAKKGE
ncbi:MAG: 50S ribosomal protein L10 [Alphaproteobacteria bacterium]|nr:50S ribosomal protein L10 [Alphaproteobacteria bacterium]